MNKAENNLITKNNTTSIEFSSKKSRFIAQSKETPVKYSFSFNSLYRNNVLKNIFSFIVDSVDSVHLSRVSHFFYREVNNYLSQILSNDFSNFSMPFENRFAQFTTFNLSSEIMYYAFSMRNPSINACAQFKLLFDCYVNFNVNLWAICGFKFTAETNVYKLIITEDKIITLNFNNFTDRLILSKFIEHYFYSKKIMEDFNSQDSSKKQIILFWIKFFNQNKISNDSFNYNLKLLEEFFNFLHPIHKDTTNCNQNTLKTINLNEYYINIWLHSEQIHTIEKYILSFTYSDIRFEINLNDEKSISENFNLLEMFLEAYFFNWIYEKDFNAHNFNIPLNLISFIEKNKRMLQLFIKKLILYITHQYIQNYTTENLLYLTMHLVNLKFFNQNQIAFLKNQTILIAKTVPYNSYIGINAIMLAHALLKQNLSLNTDAMKYLTAYAIHQLNSKLEPINKLNAIDLLTLIINSDPEQIQIFKRYAIQLFLNAGSNYPFFNKLQTKSLFLLGKLIYNHKIALNENEIELILGSIIKKLKDSNNELVIELKCDIFMFLVSLLPKENLKLTKKQVEFFKEYVFSILKNPNPNFNIEYLNPLKAFLGTLINKYSKYFDEIKQNPESLNFLKDNFIHLITNDCTLVCNFQGIRGIMTLLEEYNLELNNNEKCLIKENLLKIIKNNKFNYIHKINIILLLNIIQKYDNTSPQTFYEFINKDFLNLIYSNLSIKNLKLPQKGLSNLKQFLKLFSNYPDNYCQSIIHECFKLLENIENVT